MDIPKTNALAMPFPGRNGKVGSAGRVSAADRWLVRTFLCAIGEPALRVVLWDGRDIAADGSAPAVGMLIHDRATLWRLLTNPLLHFGDDYSAGRIEIEGGLVVFLETVYRAMNCTPKFRRISDSAAYRRNQPNLNSPPESRRNIHHHYDIGNDFYQLWLDAEML